MAVENYIFKNWHFTAFQMFHVYKRDTRYSQELENIYRGMLKPFKKVYNS